jgi:hypothetical protein
MSIAQKKGEMDDFAFPGSLKLTDVGSVDISEAYNASIFRIEINDSRAS